MQRIALLTSLFFIGALAAPQQLPLDREGEATFGSDGAHFKFSKNIERVAVVGAGVSGLIATGALLDHNLTVRAFERAPHPGGNWYYTEQTPLPASYDDVAPSEADFKPSPPSSFPHSESIEGPEAVEREWRAHWLPRAVYAGLHNNNPIRSLKPLHTIRELPWPSDTAWTQHHSRVQAYVRAYASFKGLNSNDPLSSSLISYSTRVELAERTPRGWTLTLRKKFDALLVASGRYNAANVPRTKGLRQWAEREEGKVVHSREYRHPEGYTNETVLIVGAATSGVDIAKEIGPFAKTIYQSIRNASSSDYRKDYITGRLPRKSHVVPEVAEYFEDGSSLLLKNGTVLHGIVRVILATGYTRTFPFLQHLHSDDAVASNQFPVVTDGSHVQNLYLDTFYIPDPTLAFTVQNIFIAGPFRLAEYQSTAAAKVWSGTARLPSQSTQWSEYHAAHEGRIPGKAFNVLGPDGTNDLVRKFVGWLSNEAVEFGRSQIEGYPAQRCESVWEVQRHFGSPAEWNPLGDQVPAADVSLWNAAEGEDGFGDY